MYPCFLFQLFCPEKIIYISRMWKTVKYSRSTGLALEKLKRKNVFRAQIEFIVLILQDVSF